MLYTEFKKEIFFYIMAFFYYIFYLFPINNDKILLIMTHDDSLEGNIMSTYSFFKKKNNNYFPVKITKDDYDFHQGNIIKKLFKITIYLPYSISTSKHIFIDNIFLPFSKIKPKDKSNLVQLWHGSYSIKKFGFDVEEGWIRSRGLESCKNTTHFIVSSKKSKKLFSSALNAPFDKMFDIGSPRTDMFFNEDIISEKKTKFLNDFPIIKDKKLVLYSPTFRDEELKEKELKIDINILKILANIDENIIFAVRLHPQISKKLDLDKYLNKFNSNQFLDLSNYPNLNSILLNCDVLITDYSSIIFEYSLLKHPMIFYAPDLDNFKVEGRGFYNDYETFVPGPVVEDYKEIIDLLNRLNSNSVKDISSKNNKLNNNILKDSTSKDNTHNHDLDRFTSIYMENCDGKSRERLYNILN